MATFSHVVVLIVVCFCFSTEACLCFGGRLGREEAFNKADFVSNVRILNQTVNTEDGVIVYDVEHLRVFKSDQSNLTLPPQIHTSTSDCGISHLRIGNDYLLSGNFLNESYHIAQCSAHVQLTQDGKIKERVKKLVCRDLCFNCKGERCEGKKEVCRPMCKNEFVDIETDLEEDEDLKKLLLL